VWDAEGKFVRILGREGKGPGEFARSGKFIGFSRSGDVFIADNQRRWSVFSSGLEFLRTLPATATGTAMSNTGFITDDGLFVGSGASRTGNAFTVFDLSRPATEGSPMVVRSFGKATAGRARPVTPATGLNFWAGPAENSADGYVFELWQTDGTLLRTFRRDVPWFKTRSVATTRRPDGAPDESVPPPEFEVVNDDGTGILLVEIMMPNAAKWRDLSQVTDRVQRRALQNEMIDIYLEAIDGNSGVVLASWGPQHPEAAIKVIPTGFFARSRTGYRREEDADGFGILRIVELRLVAN
jgi:hypothetical protein